MNKTRWILGLLGLASLAGLACVSHNDFGLNSVGPNAPQYSSSNPNALYLWRNGSWGGFLGQGINTFAHHPAALYLNQELDPITGDTQALTLASSSTITAGTINFTVWSCVDASGAYPSSTGHIQFDMRAEQTLTQVVASYGCGGTLATLTFSAGELSALTPGSFVHESLPLAAPASFSSDQTTGVGLALAVSVIPQNSGNAASFNNVKWTAN
jgi:hypothetical protein